MGADFCTMCEEGAATTTWGGFPACQLCVDFLTDLNGYLKAMEADDPDLAAKGQAVEKAWNATHHNDGGR